MKRINKEWLKKVLLTTMWLVIGAGTITLLVAAVRAKNLKHCKGLEINISGVNNNFFIGKDDVRKVISSYAGDDLSAIETEGFNLVAMETELKREVWVKNANLYFDNNAVLQAEVEEREPIARVFTKNGETFYIDTSNMILPLSDKLSARLPVFTGFPTDAKVLSKTDSALLNDIKNLSVAIQEDAFLMGMIDQVDITDQRNFELIPKLGEQTILFGTAQDAEQKFSKLKLFYKKMIPVSGWNKYSVINLQYKGQVLGKIKGKDDVSADSLRTVEIMHAIAMNAARAASDSLQMMMQDNEKNTTDISLIQVSMERDEMEQASPFDKFPGGKVEIPALANKPAPVEKAIVPAGENKVTRPVVKPIVKAAAVAPKMMAPANRPAVMRKPLVKKTVITKPVVKITKQPVLNKPKQITLPPKKAAVQQNKNDY